LLGIWLQDTCTVILSKEKTITPTQTASAVHQSLWCSGSTAAVKEVCHPPCTSLPAKHKEMPTETVAALSLGANGCHNNSMRYGNALKAFYW
jgi:hypothetical protein